MPPRSAAQTPAPLAGGDVRDPFLRRITPFGGRIWTFVNNAGNAGDWVLLREQAARHRDSPSQVTALTASRMLVLALANSTERADKETAVSLYLQLQQRGALDATDFGNWALLLMDLGDPGRGQDVILLGIAACTGSAIGHLADVGHRIVEGTGDRDFRERLNTAIAARNTP